MLGEQIRERLHNGACTYGTHVTLMSNTTAASMLSDVELDFAFICGEHMPLDRVETAALCQLYAGKGISPIVRISHPSAVEAAKALDAGAQGIVAPYVETVEQVREVVGAVHYRPIKGRLLEEFLSGTREPAAKTRAFLQRFNRHSYAIIGVESVAAYEDLDDLIRVEGVDGVFVGPHDLTVSMEVPEEYDNPSFLRVLEDIIIRGRAAGIGGGLHHFPQGFSLEQVRRFMELGMNWILDAADVVWARQAYRERREALDLQAERAEPSDADGRPQTCVTSAADE